MKNETDIIRIKPYSTWSLFDFRELWDFRELFLIFVWRDIKVRYKQTIIGGFWAVLQPFLTMIIFSFFFGKIAKIPSEGIPYPVFSYSGLLLWIYFSNALSSTSNSMISNSGLITKVYFPRIILPIASALTGIIDYIVAYSILFVLLFCFHIKISYLMIFLPFIMTGTFLLVVGLGFWLSALNVRFRDIRFVLPFFIQLLVFITPVIYPTSVAGNYKWIIILNPMTGFIEAHRALILNQQVNLIFLLISFILTIIIFVSGLFYFKTVENYFADII